VRLIGPWLFVFVGLLIGGLFVRDILDITWGGKLGGAFVAAVVGAVVLTVIGNLAYNALILHKDGD